MHDALPADVRLMLGSDASDAPAVDPAVADRIAHALGAAVASLDAKIASMQGELSDVRQAGAGAQVELLVQQSLLAEVGHAAALAAYLPHLAALRKAHAAAHDFMPSLPDFERLCDELPEAEPEQGVLRRVAGKLAAVLVP
jgi:hypothetical protein